MEEINNIKIAVAGEHYRQNGKDLFDLCKQGLVNDEEYKAFLKINCYKYLRRYQDKNGLEDLYKAQKYLEELIKNEEKNGL